MHLCAFFPRSGSCLQPTKDNGPLEAIIPQWRGKLTAMTYFDKDLPHVFGARIYLRHVGGLRTCRQQRQWTIKGRVCLISTIIPV